MNGAGDMALGMKQEMAARGQRRIWDGKGLVGAAGIDGMTIVTQLPYAHRQSAWLTGLFIGTLWPVVRITGTFAP
jgi:hypothetical protein